jgi:hypothetical protein
MNLGQIGAYLGILLGLISSVGYAFAGDARRSLYFFLGACITLCVTWK